MRFRFLKVSQVFSIFSNFHQKADEENSSADAQTEIDAGAKFATPQERLKMPRLAFNVSTDVDLQR